MRTNYYPFKRKRLTMSLLMMTLLLLCPAVIMAQKKASVGIFNAEPVEIQGECNASDLNCTEDYPSRIVLKGNTTLYVDCNSYVNEITGPYDLTIVQKPLGNYLQSETYTLTVEQDYKNTPAVSVNNLTIKGNGTTEISGGNTGVRLAANGKLNIENTKVDITARNEGFAIMGVKGNSVTINNSKVNISSGYYAFMGLIDDGLNSDPDLKSFTVKGGASNVSITGSIGLLMPTMPSSAQFQIGLFRVENGTVTVNGRKNKPTTIYADKVELLGGKVTVTQSGASSMCGDRYLLKSMDAGINTNILKIQDCELNVTTNWNGIIAWTEMNVDNSTVNVQTGTESAAIYSPRGKLLVRGAETELTADGYAAGIYVRDVDIQCRRLVASGHHDGAYGLYTAGKLNIDLCDRNSLYMITCGNQNPCRAEGGIYMKKPCDVRFTRSKGIYHEGGQEFERTMIVGYGNILWLQVPQASDVLGKPVNTELVYAGDTRKVSLGSARDLITWDDPQVEFSLYRKQDGGAPRLVNDYGEVEKNWETDRTFLPGDVGYTLYGVFSASPCSGTVNTSWAYRVVRRENDREPVKPNINWRLGSVNILNPSRTTVDINGTSVTLEQEYLVLDDYKDVSSLTDADWANAETPTDFSQTYKMKTAASGKQLFVYTRYAANGYFNAGKIVASTSVNSGAAGTTTKSVRFEATGMNQTISLDQDGTYIVPRNTIVKVDELPIPDNATDFTGSDGECWTLYSTSAVTLYQDPECRTPIVRDASHFYKTVYFKADAVSTSWSTVYRLSVMDYPSLDPRQAMVTANFVVTDADGNIPLLNILSPQMVFVKAGEVTESEAFQFFPVTTTEGFTLKEVTPCGEGTAPVLTFNDEKRTVTVDCTDVKPGFYERVSLKNSTFFIYVEAPDQEGLTVTPAEALVDPFVGEIQLTAGVSPSSAGSVEWNWRQEYYADPVFTPASAGTVTWSSSDESVATVDANGLVRLADDLSILGKEVTITAQCEDYTATSKLTVGGKTYDLWVNGIQVNNINQDDILGDGTVSFSGNMLTLNGANITSTTSAIRSRMGSLLINVVGENSLSSSTTAVMTETAFGDDGHAITFCGNGTLDIYSNSTDVGRAISADMVYLTDTVCVNAGSNGITHVVLASNLSINSPAAELHATGKIPVAALSAYADVAEPVGGSLQKNAETGYVEVADASGSFVRNQTVVLKSEAESEEDSHLKGDVNEDGKVDISDIVAVINQIAGTATYRYADVNEDNKVDISDIVAIINIIAGQ